MKPTSVPLKIYLWRAVFTFSFMHCQLENLEGTIDFFQGPFSFLIFWASNEKVWHTRSCGSGHVCLYVQASDRMCLMPVMLMESYGGALFFHTLTNPVIV